MRMLAQFNHLYSGILMAAGSWGVTVIFVLILQTRRRSAAPGVKMGGAYLWQPSLDLAWRFCLLLVFSRILLGDLPTRSERLLSGLFLLLLCPLSIVNLILMWRRRRPEPLALSRGALFAGIQRLAGKAQIQRLSIYLLPPDSLPRLPAPPGPAVRIHRRFLDVMSRAEIDALAARQLARLQRANFDALLLVGALAAVGLCVLLHPGLAGWWLLFAGLVAVETAALALYLPRAEMQSDLRAIALTGNADAFFSALGESARLNGAPLDLPALQKTAQRAGVTPDRLRALLQPQPRPAEDRFPTSGDYATVGF
jgi:Zn-dependent protease with chaperone function